MGFKKSEVDKLLVECGRHCCVCKKYCGSKIQLHHISQKALGGGDDIENALPVCLDCHAEINNYNVKHPIGRRYQPNELRMLKRDWILKYKEIPELTLRNQSMPSVGGLEGILIELIYNTEALTIKNTGPALGRIPGRLREKEYERAISMGMLGVFGENLTRKITECYVEISKVNLAIESLTNTRPEGNAHAEAINYTIRAILKAHPIVEETRDEVRKVIEH